MLLETFAQHAKEEHRLEAYATLARRVVALGSWS